MKRLSLVIVFGLALSACTPTVDAPAALAAATPPAVAPSATFAPSPVPTLAPNPFLEPAGCRRPPDDYSRVTVNGQQLNARTLAMLQYAAQLYGGPIDVADSAITQGSFSDNGPASFGTHLSGGAVDLSVLQSNGRRVLYNESEPLVRALRTAGFAAWLRDWDELAPGSGIHVHAIAIGDTELSPEAADQLTGPFGYFRGYSGVPLAGGVPAADRHGGPLVCQWMRDLGYADLRPAAEQNPAPVDWQVKLKAAAEKYIAADQAETQQIARQIDFRPGENEDSSNMCGPLAGAILRDAGLLPGTVGPAYDLRQYWLANPATDGRPWSMFPEQDYDLYHFDTPISQFDFAAWPLRPGDFMYTYQDRDGYEHMFIITEVEAQGRAYTVTNNKQRDLTYIIQKVLLYDPTDPAAGSFKNEWVNSPHVGRTGIKGFDLLRPKGISLPADSLYDYLVRPGDTLLTVAAHFGSTFDALVRANDLSEPYTLSVGQVLHVPVNVAFRR